MIDYLCRRCGYMFCSSNGMPYCPSCDCEELEEIPFNDDKYVLPIKKESHHIHPKFMNNPKGLGQRYLIDKGKHNILHGNIMKWLWGCVRKEDKEKVIKNIIAKSKKFIGVEDDTKAT